MASDCLAAQPPAVWYFLLTSLGFNMGHFLAIPDPSAVSPLLETNIKQNPHFNLRTGVDICMYLDHAMWKHKFPSSIKQDNRSSDVLHFFLKWVNTEQNTG